MGTSGQAVIVHRLGERGVALATIVLPGIIGDVLGSVVEEGGEGVEGCVGIATLAHVQLALGLGLACAVPPVAGGLAWDGIMALSRISRDVRTRAQTSGAVSPAIDRATMMMLPRSPMASTTASAYSGGRLCRYRWGDRPR